MAKPELITSTSPAGLLDEIADMISAEPDAGWCVVVPRTHLARDVTTALLERNPTRAWVGNRVLTVDDLVAHYARALDARPALTPLQVRQIIAAVVREIYEESGGAVFEGQVIDGRVSESLLRSLTRLFAELEPFRWSPDDLEERLKGDRESLQVEDRAWQVAEVYRRYMARLSATRYQGPQGQAVTAVELAQTAPPPDGVRSFLFLGLDTSGFKDVGVRMVYALAKNPAIERVVWALVLPAKLDTAETAWKTHGNSHLYEHWMEDFGTRTHIESTNRITGLPEDLAALVFDPFAYRLERAKTTGAVRAVRVPDTQLEIDWVATDIKRRVLEGNVAPERIAVIARNMDLRAEDFERVFGEFSIPVVSSRETPIHNVPVVGAVLALFRLIAFGWRLSDLVSVAESPYLATGLNPTLLARIGSMGTSPDGPADWESRIAAFQREATVAEAQGKNIRNDLPARYARTATELAEKFRAFLADVRAVAGDGAALTPAEWVAALVKAVERWSLERRIYDIAPAVDRDQRAMLVRADLDGLNALIRAAHDWHAGREIAGLGNEPLDARTWYAELEVIAAESRIRSSTFPRDAVHLLLPAQAALREWDVVYVVGLADGIFPVHTEITDHTLSDEERRALHLPTAEQRAARERLLFHLSVATARRELILVAPATDDRGKALVTSQFMTCLPLRIEGLQIEQVTARGMVPTRIEQIFRPGDVDLFATERYRAYAEAAESEADLERLVREDSIVRGWLARPMTRYVTEAWAVERLRGLLDRTLENGADNPDGIPLGEFVGLIPASRLPEWVRSDEAIFSPTELDIYGRCNFRFFLSRLVGLRAGPDQEEDHDEAAAFGTLQHRILERLYNDLKSENLLPPTSHADIDAAIERLRHVARAAVRDYMASAHERLWEIDFDFVLNVLKDFVRRDLARMLEIEKNDEATEPRRRLVDLETWVGPVPVDIDDVRFQLHGRIDRVEEITDDRLPAEAQGWLHLADYKTSRTRSPSLNSYLSGEKLHQLPLYVYMAEKHFGRRVFGYGELRTAHSADPRPVQIREMALNPDGRVELIDVPGVSGNPVAASRNIALNVAAGMVRQIRNGRLAPQPGRQCFGCRFKDICRAATMADPARFRDRAQIPLVVDARTYARAEQRVGRTKRSSD